MKITGLASVTFDPRNPAGTEFQLTDSMVERIAPNAFDGELTKGSVWCGFNHSPDNPLGRISAGTLRLSRDPGGLRYEVQLPSSPVGVTVGEAVRRRDVTGASFAFYVVQQSFTQEVRGKTTVIVRTVEKVELLELGPVTVPAYGATTAEAIPS